MGAQEAVDFSSTWECKYHVVWIPKGRQKRLYGGVANIGEVYFSSW
jgi:REP element-mobilizing transposase RayT